MATEIQNQGTYNKPAIGQPIARQESEKPENLNSVTQAPAAVDDKQVSGQQKQVDQVSKEQLQQAVQDLRDFAKSQNRALEFSVDDVTGRTLVKVVDSETSKVIRQIPSETAVDLARRMHDQKGGILEELA